MNILFIIIGAAAVLFAAYKLYGSFLSRKVFQLDDSKITPAVLNNDGVDFVPTNSKFLTGQHFSAISGAGPISGPIIAGIMFGWVPALIWILIGSVFIGGVHDMGSIISSVRHQAKSITEVIRINVSKRAWILFLVFIWISLVYVIVAFTDITSSSFTGTVVLENGESVGGGAIATSSLLYLILPMFMGLLLKKTKLSLTWATIIFLPLVGFSIWIGSYIPFQLESIFNVSVLSAHKIWNAFLLIYCLIASVIPMWLLLQPRGHLGGYFMYASLLTAAIGLIFGGFSINYPAFTTFGDENQSGWFPMFPILFITVACGACSGFHSLVGSGTTSKQLKKESDSKIVGYGMMLMEAMVAVVALACVMILFENDNLVKSSPNFIFASGIGKFVELIGISAAFGISFGLMAFTTFVYDTLDVCARLSRYIIQELTGWKNLPGKILAATISVGVPLFFVSINLTDANGNIVPSWKIFWNIFGSSNQMLASITLLGISVWLHQCSKRKKAWLITFIPALFMYLISNWALLVLIQQNWFTDGKLSLNSNPIPIVSVVICLLSLILAIEMFYVIFFKKKVITTPVISS